MSAQIVLSTSNARTGSLAAQGLPTNRASRTRAKAGEPSEQPVSSAGTLSFRACSLQIALRLGCDTAPDCLRLRASSLRIRTSTSWMNRQGTFAPFLSFRSPLPLLSLSLSLSLSAALYERLWRLQCCSSLLPRGTQQSKSLTDFALDSPAQFIGASLMVAFW